jgi:CelD/BcsL family acetyltransferase involved in cellulose biosynthesis
MTVRVLRSDSELRDVIEPWTALADAAGARHNMQPFWCLPWWSHVESGELHVVVVESDGHLTALAPLYRKRRAGVDTLRFIGAMILGVSEVLVSPDHPEAGDELWEYLLGLPRCVLDLRQQRLRSPGIEALRRNERSPWRAELGPASPGVAISGSWDDYWTGRRTKFKSDLQRRERVAERENMAVRVEVAREMSDVEKRLSDVTQIYDRVDPAQLMLHFFAGVYRPFILDMFRGAAALDRLGLFVLYLGDQPAATMFTIDNGVTMGSGGNRFDPAFGRISPGLLLWRHVFELAFSTSCTEFDLGPLDSAYKREWSTQAYDTVDISACSSDGVRALQAGKTVLRRIQARRNPSND